MEPAVSSSEQGLVCHTCGDKGFTNAFVYCVKCLEFAIHRYCLNVIPNTLNERVIWYCEDCEVKCSLNQKHKAANSTSDNSILNKNVPNGTKIVASWGVKKKRKKIQQTKISFSKDCRLLAWMLKEWEVLDESQPPTPSCDCKRLISNSSSMGNEQENYYRYGQPFIDPIWRGSFSVIGTHDDPFDGFAAHLSTKACDKVFKEATMLPSLLHLEMHPKTVLWPKSFQECEPSDDNIALYFLPGNPINVKAFDNLVLNMMDNGLAMTTTTKNAELLIFTSDFLPPLFRRLQEKYYLWGVFRGKKNDSPSVASQDLSKDSSDEGIKQTVKMMKALDNHSPRSHLSNNGIDDVVEEPFVECLDSAMGQPVSSERTVYKDDCDFVNTEPIAEWIHPRLSEHQPLVGRELFLQKLSPESQLIFEKPVKKALFVGPEIFECFVRIGWGGALNFEADEVYPEAVTEWMSTLERTGSTFENMKLTGQVNGKKVTLDTKFIRETYGVDTGIVGRPEAQYEELTEETLFKKHKGNVKQWGKMMYAIFTTVSEGMLRENLTPLAKVLWRIGMRNVHPRVGGEREVCGDEVPIIYSLATGNVAFSYAQVVMMNIWRAYEFKEMRFVPHAYLISSFLKVKNVVGCMQPKLLVKENLRFITSLNMDCMVFYGVWKREGYMPQEEGQRNQDAGPMGVITD